MIMLDYIVLGLKCASALVFRACKPFLRVEKIVEAENGLVSG